MIKEFKGCKPNIKGKVAENATIIGNVTVEENASIWYGAVVRGDSESIVIGENSNVQDNAVIHCDKGFPVVIGKNVSIGHGAILHGCTIEDNCIIGMHATLLNGCVIKKNSIVGANALVSSNKVMEENSMIVGMPAKITKKLPNEVEALILKNSTEYIELSKEQL